MGVWHMACRAGARADTVYPGILDGRDGGNTWTRATCPTSFVACRTGEDV